MGMHRGVYLVCDQPGCSVDTDEQSELRGCRHPDEIERKAKAAGWEITTVVKRISESGRDLTRHYCPKHAAPQ